MYITYKRNGRVIQNTYTTNTAKVINNTQSNAVHIDNIHKHIRLAETNDFDGLIEQNYA